jgi:hypothetical protein
MPTAARAPSRAAKLPASPDSAVAKLQQPTPNAINFGRLRRSPSAPNTGAAKVNTRRNADINDPASASFSLSSECFKLSTSAETRYRSK